MSRVTRFAPSPTGHLHLGHAYSAIFAQKLAKNANDQFLLRIEDIDTTRCRKEFEQGIFADLKWLGLDWLEPVRKQSEHLDDYLLALAKLDEENLIYPCFCTRAKITEEIERAGIAPSSYGEAVYPGICKKLTAAEREELIEKGQVPALRLDMAAAFRRTGVIEWKDHEKGKVRSDPRVHGDIVLARKDIKTSYHLSATIDDHLQGITLVTRGEDLAGVTDIHRLLQEILNLNEPEYRHHKILKDKRGKKLSKRSSSTSIQSLRGAGYTQTEIINMIKSML